MCAHEDDALCDRVHFSNCFIAGHMTSDQLASELILKASRETVYRLARYLVS